jgi:hypothetical protein
MVGMAERFVIPDDLARAAASEGRGDCRPWSRGSPPWRIEVATPRGAQFAFAVSELDGASLERWLFARAVEASPYWVGMATWLGGRFFGE